MIPVTINAMIGWRRILLAIVALNLGAVIWLPVLHLFYKEDASGYFAHNGVHPRARRLAARHLELWVDDHLRQEELQKMRGSNAEWDFMGRTFLVLALANLSLREPERAREYLEVMDAIIDDTLAVESSRGMHHFLMDYSRSSSFRQDPPRSLFVDGEIALMLGARRAIEEHPGYGSLFSGRIETIGRRLADAPVLCGESYPDECWMFCNAAALAALRISDYLDETDHRAFFASWISTVRAKLLDRRTDLLPSSFTYGGTTMDGPEGSSIWFVAHCLQLIDQDFALDQFVRAKKELATSICGFAYAREWPASWKGAMDIDSGPIIPVLEVSAGSSGMAFIAAAAFRDEEFLASLLATLDFAAFPKQTRGRLKYCASNQVGDAVLLYSLVMGPLWYQISEGGAHGG